MAMVLGGLRAAEVRSLQLSEVDLGLRWARVVRTGGKERVVLIDDVFFSECAAYLRSERPAGCRTGVPRGAARPDTWPAHDRGVHRARSGAITVRPHPLRHTYGTELAAAVMDLLVLRKLMGVLFRVSTVPARPRRANT